MKLGNLLSTVAFWSMLAWLLLWIITELTGPDRAWVVAGLAAGYVLARRARKAASRD